MIFPNHLLNPSTPSPLPGACVPATAGTHADLLVIYYALRCERVLNYEVGQDDRIHFIVQKHGWCTVLVSQDLQCSARFSYTSDFATTWLLCGARISKYLQCRARSSNTFISCNIVAVRCSCHKIFNVVQDSRIHVIMQQHGCRTVSYHKNTSNAVEDSRTVAATI